MNCWIEGYFCGALGSGRVLRSWRQSPGVFGFALPQRPERRLGKSQGACSRRGLDQWRRRGFVGLIGAALAEAAGSIAGRQLYRDQLRAAEN